MICFLGFWLESVSGLSPIKLLLSACVSNLQIRNSHTDSSVERPRSSGFLKVHVDIAYTAFEMLNCVCQGDFIHVIFGAGSGEVKKNVEPKGLL